MQGGRPPLHPPRGLAFFAVASVLLVVFGVDLVGEIAGATPLHRDNSRFSSLRRGGQGGGPWPHPHPSYDGKGEGRTPVLPQPD